MNQRVVDAIEIFTALAERMAKDGLDPKVQAQHIAESYANRDRSEDTLERKPNTGE